MATLVADRQYLRELRREYVVDISRSRNGVEQRRLVDDEVTIGFEFHAPLLDLSDMQTLQAFWDARNGPFEAFDFESPFDGITYSCRFEEGSWSCDEIADETGIHRVAFSFLTLEVSP